MADSYKGPLRSPLGSPEAVERKHHEGEDAYRSVHDKIAHVISADGPDAGHIGDIIPRGQVSDQYSMGKSIPVDYKVQTDENEAGLEPHRQGFEEMIPLDQEGLYSPTHEYSRGKGNWDYPTPGPTAGYRPGKKDLEPKGDPY